jgi:hypothetical protein
MSLNARSACRQLFAPTVLAVLAATGPARAQVDVPPPDFVFSPPFAPADGFGQHVATDGTVVAALDTSHVAIYARTGAWPSWALQDTLPLWSTTASAVAVDGERLVVGETLAPGHPAGVARVFRRAGSTWLEEAVLSPSSGSPGDEFGSSVDIDGSTITIGAPGHGIGGAVYVFTQEGSGWSQRAALLADDAASGDGFGAAVGLSGDVIVVGAPTADVGTLVDAGTAYVFEGAGAAWSQQARFVEPLGDTSHRFGRTVAADADTVIVGSPDADTPAAPIAGAAYAYARTGGTWSPQGQLAATSPWAHSADGAGFSVALQGEQAILGAPFATSPVWPESLAGILLVFERSGTTWSFAGAQGSPSAFSGNVMGWSVALGADTMVGGAPDWGGGEGSIHVFVSGIDEVMPPWLDLGYGLAGTAGVPRLSGDGPLTPGSPGSLTLSQAAPLVLAMGLVGPVESPTAFKGGTLVPLPPQLVLFVTTSSDGDWVARWNAFPPGLPPLTAFFIQFTVADVGAVHGVALSNALAGTTQ